MTLASTIVQSAYREGNLIPMGKDPTAAQLAEGLAKLNRLLAGLFGNEVGEPLTEWPLPPPQRTAPVAARYPLGPASSDLPSNVWPYPPGNVRLMCSIAVATRLYFQNAPNDGARVNLVNLSMSATLTLDGNGRLIESIPGVSAATRVLTAPIVLSTDWFYRSDLGTWVVLTTLLSTDSLPFPSNFDDYFVAELHIRMCPSFGRTATNETTETRNRNLSKLKARYRQPTAALGNADDAPSTQRGGAGDFGWMT